MPAPKKTTTKEAADIEPGENDIFVEDGGIKLTINDVVTTLSRDEAYTLQKDLAALE